MLQLIYASHATPGAPDASVHALCRQAAHNNVRDEITGVLLRRDGHFLQVLEGPKEQVENTFLRIVNDQRHHSLLLLFRAQVTARQFGGWAMAICDRDGEQRAIIDRIDRMIAKAPDHVRERFEAIFAE